MKLPENLEGQDTPRSFDGHHDGQDLENLEGQDIPRSFDDHDEQGLLPKTPESELGEESLREQKLESRYYRGSCTKFSRDD